jgi:hypothetical protein
MKMQRKLTQDSLETLIATGSAREFIATRQNDKWALLVRSGTQTMILGSQRQSERLWGSLDTLSDFVAALGIRKLQIEL